MRYLHPPGVPSVRTTERQARHIKTEHENSSRLDLDFLPNAVRLAGLGLSIDLLDQIGDAKQLVHSLQAKTLGLGNEEPHEDAHDEAKAAKHEEHALVASQYTNVRVLR